jgi:fibronectin type 3 domain-containing protein
MNKIFLALILFVMVLSCSLEHSNPLDPENSGIDAPNEISGINVMLTTQNHVSLNWNPQQNIDGYFIYRSFSEDGQFDREAILSNTTSSYTDEITITNYHTWYKLSAYIIVEEDSLEGMRSDPKTWNN